MERLASVVGLRMPAALIERLRAFSERTGMPYARTVRAVLECVPFDDPTVIPIVLKVPKATAADPRRLDVWLESACDDVRRFFGPTDSLPR